MNKHNYIGKNLEEAKNMAMTDLRETIDNLYIKEKNIKNGLFNKKVEIEVIEKQEVIEFIKDYIKNITKQMGIQVQVEIKKTEDMVIFTMYSDHDALLIGKNGQTLEALTTITRHVVQNELGFKFKFLLDVEEYKKKHQLDLERLARKLAHEVKETKVEIKLDSMNSYERRIIHNTLSNKKGIYTESVGEEPNRCVVIKPTED